MKKRRTSNLLTRADPCGKSAAGGLSACIALGSNQGDRRRHLVRARAALAALHQGPGVPRVSALYETEPDGCEPGTPAFLNAVMEIRFAGSPTALLRESRRIEHDAGRAWRRLRNSPRPLDLDIICFGTIRMETRRLSLPHPRAARRRFVLQPLSDIAPDLVLPGRRRTVSQLLEPLPPRPLVRRVTRRW